MNLKNDLNLAFKPKLLSNVTEANFSKGVKLMVVYAVIWLVIHVVLALINGVIDGSPLGSVFLFSFLVGLAATVAGVVGLLIVGLVGGYLTVLFKGAKNIQKTIGLMAYGVLPLFVIGVLRDLLLFVSTLGNHFLADIFVWLNFVLFLVFFLWLAWLATEAVDLANNLDKKWKGFVCFLIGFLVALGINWLIGDVLVRLVGGVLVGVL